MKNMISSGATLTLLAPYDRESGEGALIGYLFGISSYKVASGEEGEFDTSGVFDLRKATADDFSAGDPAYWDDSAKEVTATSTGNHLIGAVVEAAGNGVALAAVRLNGVSVPPAGATS